MSKWISSLHVDCCGTKSLQLSVSNVLLHLCHWLWKRMYWMWLFRMFWMIWENTWYSIYHLSQTNSSSNNNCSFVILFLFNSLFLLLAVHSELLCIFNDNLVSKKWVMLRICIHSFLFVWCLNIIKRTYAGSSGYFCPFKKIANFLRSLASLSFSQNSSKFLLRPGISVNFKLIILFFSNLKLRNID